MDPITIGLVVAGVASATAGTVKTVADFQGSRQQAKALNRQANQVEAGAEIDAASRSRQARRFASSQMLRASASGVDISGSPSILTAETLASATAESDAERRQAGAQAGALRNQAKQVKKAGNIAVATDIIGTVGSLAMLGAMAGARPSGPITTGPAANLGASTLAPGGNVTGAMVGSLPVAPTPKFDFFPGTLK